MHRRIDGTVERLLFRRQYREDAALRSFARECAFVMQPEKWLDLTVDQIGLHAGATWVAVYKEIGEGYVRIRQRGSHALPAQVDVDDLAFVKLRSRGAEVDLNDTPSALGQIGYAFPLHVRGNLLGALVVGPRTGEHYVMDERELFAHVAHEVGATMFALEAQATETLLNDARAREAALLELLRSNGATAKP